MAGIEVAGGKKIILPLSRAVEIAMRSLKIRFGRSLITTSGVVLAIAFLMSVWSSNAIVSSLRDANKSEINLLLQMFLNKLKKDLFILLNLLYYQAQQKN